MDIRGARRLADVRLFTLFGLLHHVCGVDNTHSWSGDWIVLGPLQLVDNGWNYLYSGTDFCHDHDNTVLGNVDEFTLLRGKRKHTY